MRLTPGMKKARKETERAETDVDERIGRADSALHPDGNGRKEDGN
jgi:hypothetical protein